MSKFNEQFTDSYIAADIETTGLSPEYDSIIEIAAVKVIDNEIADTFSTLINPHRRINAYITELTGINNSMVRNAPDISVGIKKFMEFAGDYTLLGHNFIHFDMKFLSRQAQFFNNCIDTLYIAGKIRSCSGGRSLSDLCRQYGIINDNAHRALSDCIATHKVYQALKNDYAENGAYLKMSVFCGRKALQENIGLYCREGMSLKYSKNEKKELILSAEGFPVGIVSGKKLCELEDNEEFIRNIYISKIGKGSKDNFLLEITAEISGKVRQML